MQGSHTHLRAYTALLVILIVLVGFFYALYASGVFGPAQTSQPSQASFPSNAPPPTAADYVSAQQNFNYLVSYTVSGFHPTTLSMKVGETVRFTNNDTAQIVISGANTQSSALVHGAYWQYTANSTGTFTFTAGTASIKVTVTK